MQSEFYDPLDYANLTANLVRELMIREPVVLPPEPAFSGPGVYALFYCGEYAAYQHQRIRSNDSTHPIYVGKAVPAGARKGGTQFNPQSMELHKRLLEHTCSIGEANNLEIADFRCRYLTVVPLWIVNAERFLLEHYKPIWNVCIEGFGNHNPGKGRHEGEISWWDALHPGREWATRLRQTKTSEKALRRLQKFLATQGTLK